MLLSSAANIPESDFPFEFSSAKGSIVTDENVLTQSITNDGEVILKTNNPQPIIKYKSGVTNNGGVNSESYSNSNGSGNGYNKNGKIQSTKVNNNGNSKTGQNYKKKSSNTNPQSNGYVVKGVYHLPYKHIESSIDSSSFTNDDQWELFENLYKYAK